jgi:hypothetical protein
LEAEANAKTDATTSHGTQARKKNDVKREGEEGDDKNDEAFPCGWSQQKRGKQGIVA